MVKMTGGASISNWMKMVSLSLEKMASQSCVMGNVDLTQVNSNSALMVSRSWAPMAGRSERFDAKVEEAVVEMMSMSSVLMVSL